MIFRFFGTIFKVFRMIFSVFRMFVSVFRVSVNVFSLAERPLRRRDEVHRAWNLWSQVKKEKGECSDR